MFKSNIHFSDKELAEFYKPHVLIFIDRKLNIHFTRSLEKMQKL